MPPRVRRAPLAHLPSLQEPGGGGFARGPFMCRREWGAKGEGGVPLSRVTPRLRVTLACKPGEEGGLPRHFWDDAQPTSRMSPSGARRGWGSKGGGPSHSCGTCRMPPG